MTTGLETDPTAGPSVDAHAGDARSTVQVLGDILTELQTLVKKEIELAKQELLEAVSTRAQAAAAAVGGAIFGLFTLAFLGVTIAAALANAVPAWLAWLIVTLLYGLIAGAAFLIARSRARAVPMQPEQTKRSVEENVTWAKQQLRR